MKKLIFTLGTTAILSAGFAGGASASGTYQVQEGDTLWKIAQKHEVSVNELKDANNLTSTIIYPNQNLNVSIIKEITHRVEHGDTLWSIAQKYGVTVDQIKAWNELANDVIFPGQKFAIEASSASQQSQPVAVQEKAAAPVAKAEPAQEAAEPAPQPEPTQEAAEPAPQPEPAQEAAAPAPQPEPAQEAAAPAPQPEPAQEVAAPAPQPEPAQEVAAPQPEPAQEQPAEQAQGKKLTVEATAYTANCAGCSGITATGVNLKANPNQKVIAVDPSVIPLGSRVYVEGYGEAIAADTGGAIKGNKIDVFVPSQSTAQQWGRKTVTVTVLN
ncbi:LysM peptidoglycan-binding domain-containing protein [Priestia megaterium]|nr:LysM peptidoglycan-binding domain-containing protein [Priestia megaterium]